MNTTQTTEATEAVTVDSLDKFTRHYLICALWSSYDWSDESGGEPLDANYDLEDCAPEMLAQAAKECRDFRDLCLQEMGPDAFEDWSDEQAGHDFWLTRNGHGAGFWDRGFENGDELSKWAKSFGSRDLYVGDDGRIHSG